MSDPYIEYRHITKKFAGVTALDDVSFSIARGECHALMGENGAGKSTLGKILAGIYRPDGGQLFINGQEMHLHNPADAQKAGVGMVYQELAFVPELSIAENLNMGQYPGRLGLVDGRAMRKRAEELLHRIGASLDVTRPMRTLSTAQEQMVQIASAVGTGADILVFDEPTSSLSEPEAQNLFTLIEQLRARGVTMIYVSHRMPEVFRLCDRLSVLRDGRYVGTLTRAEATQDAVVRMMIGRSVEAYFPEHLNDKPGKIILSVSGLSSPGKFRDVNFEVRAGEIVGFAGLVGAGRSEIAKAIFGLDPDATGNVTVEGEPLPLRDIRQSMRRGIGLVPEDRKREGLVLMMGCRQNFSMAMLDRLRRMGILDFRQEKKLAIEYFDKLRVKTASLDTPVMGLSGGNQQKIALAKWLGRGAKLLIVDEPTRGVDIGAKIAIHGLIDQLARQGVGIILISSELPELLNLSTRVLAMREGRMVGELSRDEISQERVMRLMAGMETQV
ncbi:MAG: sugar ABC transporter ATP-binding protein [Phycisphaerae bacterium]|nr:sugar ABC transporter ATP-binding protein [Phycisphaerae bacterium]